MHETDIVNADTCISDRDGLVIVTVLRDLSEQLDYRGDDHRIRDAVYCINRLPSGDTGKPPRHYLQYGVLPGLDVVARLRVAKETPDFTDYLSTKTNDLFRVPRDASRPTMMWELGDSSALTRFDLPPVRPDEYIATVTDQTVAIELVPTKLAPGVVLLLRNLLPKLRKALPHSAHMCDEAMTELEAARALCSEVGDAAASDDPDASEVPLTYVNFYEWWSELFDAMDLSGETDDEMRERLYVMITAATQQLLQHVDSTTPAAATNSD